MHQTQKYILITRSPQENKDFKNQLEHLGFAVLEYPAISITKSVLSDDEKRSLQIFFSFDWILFTSVNGVRFFMEALAELHIDAAVLQTKKIGAVGPKTAEEIEKYHLHTSFIPSAFTTEDLARELPGVGGKRILLPRSNIANPALKEQLEARGAMVTNVPIYITVSNAEEHGSLSFLVAHHQIRYITFTSPSTVEGFLSSMKDTQEKEKIFSIPVLSIGPVTTEAAKRHGFQSIYTSEVHTIEGMLAKLQKDFS